MAFARAHATAVAGGFDLPFRGNLPFAQAKDHMVRAGLPMRLDP